MHFQNYHKKQENLVSANTISDELKIGREFLGGVGHYFYYYSILKITQKLWRRRQGECFW